VQLVVFSLLVYVVLAATVVVWTVIVQRLYRREPVLPVEPRRQVPWLGRDLVLFVVVFILAQTFLAAIRQAVIPPDACEKISAGVRDEAARNLARNHPLTEIFMKGTTSSRIACTLLAVVVAPVFEELVFRLFLQGWLEKVDRRLRRRARWLAVACRWGTGPVVFSSLLFALLHLRGERALSAPDQMVFSIMSYAVVSVLLSVALVLYLRGVRGATWADLGFARSRVASDVKLGLAAYAAVVVPVCAAMALLTKLAEDLPSYLAPDPAPLFAFALVLGFVYLRTHRVLPTIIAHAALNGGTLLLLWLGAAA